MKKKEGFNQEELERLRLEVERLKKRYNKEFLRYLVVAFKTLIEKE